MDDTVLVSALNDITAAVGIIASLTPSGSPEAMRLLNQARTLVNPPPPAAPVNQDVPAVTGNAAVGETLTCTKGNWSGEPTSYAYQWRRDGSEIGSDSESYTVDAADAGHAIDCVVTATNAVGSSAAPPSNAIAIPAAAEETHSSSRRSRSSD